MTVSFFLIRNKCLLRKECHVSVFASLQNIVFYIMWITLKSLSSYVAGIWSLKVRPAVIFPKVGTPLFFVFPFVQALPTHNTMKGCIFFLYLYFVFPFIQALPTHSQWRSWPYQNVNYRENKHTNLETSFPKTIRYIPSPKLTLVSSQIINSEIFE